MQINGPVTRKEFEIPDNMILMSMTDTKSRILYANEAFVDVSGFARDELLGQPHNMVRHPDMPPEAFADLWRTLGSGQSWTALVKNRRKNGDHYWVRANAAPIERDGRIVGYMSVRTKPGRDETAAAEFLYARMRDARLKNTRIYKGLVVRSGWLGLLSANQKMPLALRVAMACMAGAAAAVGVSVLGGAVGLDLALSAGGAMFGGLCCYGVMERQICAPLRIVGREAQAVASGQVAKTAGFDRVDEIGMLMRNVNQAGLNIKALIDDVALRTQVVASASSQIASGNAHLASRTESQASALEQTAAAMEQFQSTVKQNAASASDGNQMAIQASEVAEKGGAVVSQVVETMKSIDESSRRISDIIGMIDEIAFQTNILSLNAAVEAARAGEQGRGFAVVANEVRSLAGRSAEAAKEIKKLIVASTERTEAGNRLVDQARDTMTEVMRSINGVTGLMTQIMVASKEQSQGIEQVGEAVVMLDQNTQKNASLVSDSAASASALLYQAQQLVNAVNAFRQVA
ncbi:MAG: PAS domain-containing protein [Burkholderiaceae bacterium]|nr:PAS domain-containing protein [Burkholderiaceae bacterium]